MAFTLGVNGTGVEYLGSLRSVSEVVPLAAVVLYRGGLGPVIHSAGCKSIS
jgi:hypothetical protein